ncbi:YdaU family protein [Shimia sp.]|uniref:YdaU family protein n=1 Tax=Shimia sp. TaxID=1954381 RepID=UPI003BAD6468
MSLPFFPLYADDFEADTAHLTLAEDGAYNRLLRLCWRSPGCKIPADEAWVFRKLRAHSEEDKETVRIVLEEFFKKRAGKLFNPRLLKIWEESNAKHERRVEAGSKGGRAKSLKNKEVTSSNAKAKLKQPEPEPEPQLREDTDVSSLSPDDDVRPVDEIAAAVSAYNETAADCGWPKVQKLNSSRRSALAARLREAGGVTGWCAALSKARASPLCNGENDRGWVANFDFLTRQSSFAKLMEGNYDQRSRTRHQTPHTDATADAIAIAARSRRPSSPDRLRG